jgi:hypothetical protein
VTADAGSKFAWASWETAAFVAGGLVPRAIAVRVEARAKEPIIPLSIFRNRTVTLAIVLAPDHGPVPLTHCAGRT